MKKRTMLEVVTRAVELNLAPETDLDLIEYLGIENLEGNVEELCRILENVKRDGV